MKKYFGVFAFVAGMLVCGVSFAQEEGQIKTITFEDDRIEGDLMMPDVDPNGARGVEELSSLIKARDNFNGEMLKTVDLL